MQIEGLAVDLERCPDGFELVDLPRRVGDLTADEAIRLQYDFSQMETLLPPRAVFRARTDRREIQTIRLTNLENPVVVAFINATVDERRLQFFDQYGFLGLSLSDLGGGAAEQQGLLVRTKLLSFQASLREQLMWVFRREPAAAVAGMNEAIASRGFNPQVAFHLGGPRGTPRLLLKSRTLHAFMVMEAAMIVANGVAVHECEQCHTLFCTGPLTWRRSHARFCSDRCRVAAMRARKAAAETFST